MPQEEVEKKTCDLAIQVGKLSIKEIAKGIQRYNEYQKQKELKKPQKDTSIKGKQSVKALISQGQGVSSIPISDTGLKNFERIAKKYSVDFAIIKEKDAIPTKYTVFFKARDADAITQVLKEYTAKQMKNKDQHRPSVLKALKRLKEMVANRPRREQEKKKEYIR